jgi:hypothetical protein
MLLHGLWIEQMHAYTYNRSSCSEWKCAVSLDSNNEMVDLLHTFFLSEWGKDWITR